MKSSEGARWRLADGPARTSVGARVPVFFGDGPAHRLAVLHARRIHLPGDVFDPALRTAFDTGMHGDIGTFLAFNCSRRASVG
ncbi:MAG: hypothetical protein ACLT98_03390 [Eggerthellaceae bacterium]